MSHEQSIGAAIAGLLLVLCLVARKLASLAPEGRNLCVSEVPERQVAAQLFFRDSAANDAGSDLVADNDAPANLRTATALTARQSAARVAWPIVGEVMVLCGAAGVVVAAMLAGFSK